MKNNIIVDKTFLFAKDVIEVYLKLKSEKEYDIARQFLRSGTSIGANIEEAQGAQSKKDFISKISIAYKEARECNYWIRLLQTTGIWDEDITNLENK